MKKLICALLIVATLLFAGCTPDAGEQIANGGRFIVVEKHVKESDSLASIIFVDTETGVLYLCAFSYYKCGITVLLNQDGTPMVDERYVK